MELDDDSAASSDYSLLGRMYKSKSLPGPGMEISLLIAPSPFPPMTGKYLYNVFKVEGYDLPIFIYENCNVYA